MNQTILLAVDVARGGSARHVTAAVNEVRQLSRDTGDRVLVLHVHEVAYGRFGRLQVDCGDGEGEKVVDGIVSDLRSAGVTADGVVRTTDVGRISRMILAAAEEFDARMIVLGSSSHTDLPHLPFGSVSHRLLHLARRPVLIVPWRQTKDSAEEKDPAEASEPELAAEAAS